jgi:hypothetical protein
LRMHILRERSAGLHRHTVALAAAQQLKTGLDVDIVRVELCSSLIRI